MDTLFLWLKAVHVIAVISWMAGMLYLPRLFVYHCETEVGSDGSERFKIMERKLFRAIINPAMIATWVFGLGMLATGMVDLGAPWLHAKLALVVILSGVHGWFSRLRKNFEQDKNERPQKFFRLINEVPTVLMIAIVILVIVKPF